MGLSLNSLEGEVSWLSIGSRQARFVYILSLSLTEGVMRLATLVPGLASPP